MKSQYDIGDFVCRTQRDFSLSLLEAGLMGLFAGMVIMFGVIYLAGKAQKRDDDKSPYPVSKKPTGKPRDATEDIVFNEAKGRRQYRDNYID